MATLYNTDPNITYADWIQSGSADGTGITGTIKTIADGKGTFTALGLSTTQVNCANITFNGHTISSTDSAAITIVPSIVSPTLELPIVSDTTDITKAFTWILSGATTGKTMTLSSSHTAN